MIIRMLNSCYTYGYNDAKNGIITRIYLNKDARRDATVTLVVISPPRVFQALLLTVACTVIIAHI